MGSCGVEKDLNQDERKIFSREQTEQERTKKPPS